MRLLSSDRKIFRAPSRAAGLALILLLAACAMVDRKEKSFELWTESAAGLGAEINRDPSQFGRLFGLAPGFFDAREDPGQPPKPRPKKGWLGITMKPADSPPAAIEVMGVFPMSAAENAGLQPGDKIVALDGVPLTAGTENSVLLHFRDSVMRKSPGENVRLKILRGAGPLEVVATLVPRLKTDVALKPHPDLERNDGRYPNSLLDYALKKEGLADEFRRVVAEFRDRSAEVMAPRVKGKIYNPFRLREVNYVMSRPLDLPLVARKITDSLGASFNGERKDIAETLRIALEELDLDYAPPVSPARPPADLAEYLERLAQAIQEANAVRAEVLSALDAGEIDLLYRNAERLLKEDLDETKKEKSGEEKREEEEETIRFLNTALKVDLGRLLSASAAVARALDPESLLALKKKGARLDRYADGWVVREAENLTEIQTPAGKVLVGGTGSNVYKEDAAIIVDLGGDDVYLNRAGGSSPSYPFSVVVDFSGDDLYSSSADFSQGAGFFGGGFLLDLEGNDRYSARDYAQGAGVFGVGVLADFGGRDEYRGGSVVQGAATFGAGILAEGGGDDRYFADRFAQGFGFIKGFGAVVETAGNDEYFAGGAYPDGRDPQKSYESLSQGFGLGLRPYESLAGASGGIGVIAEAEGNDTYVGDYFAQGAAYWFALGILDDKKGHDKYIAGRYAQGAGIHLSAGVLLDGEGDDIYLAYFGVAQGCGHDLAVGVLLDNGGDDRYISGIIAQGAGNDNGIGVLLDNGGNDEYHIKGLGQGRGNFEPNRGLGSFGFHFDTGGGDDYYSPGGKNNRLVFRTGWGIFADTD